MKSLYLVLLLLIISFPLGASFDKRFKYASNWNSLFPAIILTGSFFVVWDVIFTKNGIWGFNENYILGYMIAGLPLEEWLFFISVPFACVFIYESVSYFFPVVTTSRKFQLFVAMLGIFLIGLAIGNFHRSYTFYCFMFTGCFVLFVAYKNPAWLGLFFIAYLFQLIPFFIFNGILTGSFLEEPVVWYNNLENLDIRMLTIPVEDSIYSLFLLLVNVTLFEFFRKRNLSKQLS